MGLYRISHPWDYHGIAAIYVAAVSPEEAVAKTKAKLAGLQPDEDGVINIGGGYGNDERIRVGRYDWQSDDDPAEPLWDEIVEVTDGVFFANGCND